MLIDNLFTMMSRSSNTGDGGVMGIFKPLYYIFGECMEGLLWLFNDKYFIALTVFTVITRLLMLPLNMKQQKSMAKTARIQPKIQKIQQKYNIREVTDPAERQKLSQKQNEEMQALYAREGHNPMNMGCGPMLFQMVFLMGIIGIIYYPIQYIIGIDISSQADAIAKAINFEGAYFQIEMLQNFAEYKDTLVSQFPQLFTADKVAEIEIYRDNLQLFGIDMTQIPHWKDGIIVIIPILCLVTSLATSLLSTLIQKKNNPAAAQQGNQMLIMMLMMPFFSFYISFQVSAAVGFYWIVSNIVALLQQLFMAKFFPPKKNQARSMIETTIERRSREESVKKIK